MLFIDFGQNLTKSTFFYLGTAGWHYRGVRGVLDGYGPKGQRSKVKGYAALGGLLSCKSIYRILFIDFGQRSKVKGQRLCGIGRPIKLQIYL